MCEGFEALSGSIPLPAIKDIVDKYGLKVRNKIPNLSADPLFAIINTEFIGRIQNKKARKLTSSGFTSGEGGP